MKTKIPERQIIKIKIAQLDWIRILSEAIKSRPTSWGKDVVREWRNASDEVWASMNKQAIEKGIWNDFLSPKEKEEVGG